MSTFRFGPSGWKDKKDEFFLLNLGDIPDNGGQSFNIDILDTLLADPIAVRKLYF